MRSTRWYLTGDTTERVENGCGLLSIASIRHQGRWNKCSACIGRGRPSTISTGHAESPSIRAYGTLIQQSETDFHIGLKNLQEQGVSATGAPEKTLKCGWLPMGEICPLLDWRRMMLENGKRGCYDNLMSQYAAWSRHNNRGANKTRERYEAAMSSFCHVLAEHFGLQKLANVQAKHLEAYVLQMSAAGNASATIKTNLSGIRYVMDSFPGRERKAPLPVNREITALANVPKRSFLGIDRAWTVEEFSFMANKAVELGRPLVAWALGLAYALGLRIHETMQIDHDRVTKALVSGYICIKGKGGLWRDIELTDLGRRILEEVLKVTPRGRRCFIEKGNVTHQQIASIQRFIRDHRAVIEVDKKVCEVRDAAYLKAVAADGYKPHITYHGLRHAYARRLYMECVNKGIGPAAARKYVAHRLGHGRDAITRIYMGSVTFKRSMKNGNRPHK